VAHDFNNLLTVINGYSDLVLSDLHADHPMREQILAIQEAGERASVLTQQLLAFGRKTIVAPKVIDLNDVVSSVTKMLRRLIGEDITLSCVLSATECRVRVDPSQLEQVLMNFAVNARDAMPSGGRLTIETGKKDTPSDVMGMTAAKCVLLSVTDTGVGMSDDVKSRIFEPFFTTKPVGKGTGLGLAVVYGIIAQAGGDIRVESTAGHGTTFEVLLPEIPSTRSDSTLVEPGRHAPRGSETVLLAEDEEAVRRFTRHVLETHGYMVLEAESSDAAIRLTESFAGPIHLLVTDVVMPDKGGRELAEAVRLLRPNLSVLYVSGYTDDALIRHGIEQEVDAFLQKPFTSLAMACKVREVLDVTRDKK
jgi:CheY-like chemotaxis protein